MLQKGAMTNDFEEAFNDAVSRAGGIMTFCRALGVTHQAVYQWRDKGYIPLERALVIEALFEVPKSRLIKPALAAALDKPLADLL
jgi:DNA-binding transcriptional regulator YdaS (Cro superfamily)